MAQFRISSVTSPIFDRWPPDWPDKKYYVSQHSVSQGQYEELEFILNSNPSETEIEVFLSNNLEVLSLLLFLYSTGHHGTFVFPKRHIRPASDFSGLIPDYLMAGVNSGGTEWFVVELKAPNTLAFRKRGKSICLSSEANRGVCQLLNYLDAASRSQGYLRDELKLSDFREPSGILVIGRAEESEDEQVRAFKGAWNRNFPNLQIRSYDALLRQVFSKVQRR
jgi:hypothetical protein